MEVGQQQQFEKISQAYFKGKTVSRWLKKVYGICVVPFRQLKLFVATYKVQKLYIFFCLDRECRTRLLSLGIEFIGYLGQHIYQLGVSSR